MILDGKKLAKQRNQILKEKIEKIDSIYRKPSLAIIQIGDDIASNIYIKNKINAAKDVGIITNHFKYNNDVTQKEIEEKIFSINNDENIDALIIQLPIAKHLDQARLLDLVSCDKDVDGFSVMHQGYLFQGRNCITSATPMGIINLLDHYNIDVCSKKVLVIGCSLIVGLPIARILLQRKGTVTIAHDKTLNLKNEVKKSDIIIVATGIPHLIKKGMIKRNSVIIDVGINKENGKTIGDCDFYDLEKYASYITPVPGGVGPMTVNALLENVFEVYKNNYMKRVQTK